MKNLKLKEFEVKDGRIIAKFLVKTGLKQTLFNVMFPKDNPNLPKNWIELRAHLQSNYDMTDSEFRDFQKEMSGNFTNALNRYLADFPAPVGESLGFTIVDVLIDVLADDAKYDATLDLIAYMFQVDRAIVELLSFDEVVEVVKSLMQSTGFFDSLQPSTPQTQMGADIQV